MEQTFQWLVIAFSLIAAVLWWISATTALPNLLTSMKLDGTGEYPEALKRQTRWSAAAAIFAGLAAFAQMLVD